MLGNGPGVPAGHEALSWRLGCWEAGGGDTAAWAGASVILKSQVGWA